MDKSLKVVEGYAQFEYIKEELSDLMQLADIVISRAGSNTIFELLALKKPNILIPLSAKASRGDQILNANSFEKSGYSKVLEEENLNALNLLEAIEEVNINKATYIENMSKSKQRDSLSKIVSLIEE